MGDDSIVKSEVFSDLLYKIYSYSAAASRFSLKRWAGFMGFFFFFLDFLDVLDLLDFLDALDILGILGGEFFELFAEVGVLVAELGYLGL